MLLYYGELKISVERNKFYALYLASNKPTVCLVACSYLATPALSLTLHSSIHMF